jgi:ubiquinone/menaquinone biosynthesis C-methylase UbiE
MRDDAIPLEEKRLSGIEQQVQYQSIHERHRIFPQCFENRGHKKILDIAAGVGIVGKRIQEQYKQGEITCNDISQTALKTMQNAGLKTLSFDLDNKDDHFPVSDNEYDAVICLATIEHMIHVDEFVAKIRRLIKDDGYLYLSTPNYAGLIYLLPVVLHGRTYHDIFDPIDRYEFYAHVRYFTYPSLLKYITAFGFTPQAVYLGVPKESSKYLRMKKANPLKALVFKAFLWGMYRFLSPRWASEPVVCFRKSEAPTRPIAPRKVIC